MPNGAEMMGTREIALLVSLLALCRGLDNNLARTPPMGWNSWGRFRCNVDCLNYPDDCISERLIRSMADRMAEDGYLQAGYQYLLIDDCWLAKSRDSLGRLQADPFRFPRGMKDLVEYVHSKGLKFGIYEDYGKYTCEGYPGIRDFTMDVDSGMFAYWEVDYVKLDGCYSDPLDMDAGYANFGRYLLSTGRPMVYACSWPFYQSNIGMSPNYSAIADNCNLWRNYADVQDSWQSVRDIVNYFGNHQEEFARYSGPQHWNDPDMLVIGNFGLSYEQAKSQMALWAILAAPLFMSHDLRNVRDEFKEILLNPCVIQINQDPMGIQGKRIFLNRKKRYEVWAKPVVPVVRGCTSWALAVVNLDDNGEPAHCYFPMRYTKLLVPYAMYDFYDVFDRNGLVKITPQNKLFVIVPPLGTRLLKAVLRDETDNPYQCYYNASRVQ